VPGPTDPRAACIDPANQQVVLCSSLPPAQ
jgi:hypothetical protein